MKKFIYSMFAVAIVAMTFASCADVPSPYGDPNNNTGGGELEEGTYLSESFATTTGFGSFTVNNITGNAWKIDYNSAYASGFNGATATPPNTASESYLVSPAVDLTASTGAYLQFDYILAYPDRDGEDKVLISSDYDGDPTTATWTDITGTLSTVTGISGSTPFSTYSVDIPTEFIGKSNVTVALYYSSTDTGSRTWEVQNLLMKEGKASIITPPTEIEGGTGTGTLEDPYDVISAINIAQKASNTSAGDVYVKGIVVSVDTTGVGQYGNLMYYISNDGTATNQFLVYRGLGLNGARFTKESVLVPGDKVVILGGIVNYNGTLEITQGSKLVSLNGDGGTPPPPPVLGEGDGTEANPYDVASIIAVGAATDVWVKGYIVGSINGTSPETQSVFSGDQASNSNTNILIALSPDETDVTKCVPIQLPTGAIRTGLSLSLNGGNYQQEVILYGDIAVYFNMPGVRTPTYAVIGSSEFGTHP